MRTNLISFGTIAAAVLFLGCNKSPDAAGTQNTGASQTPTAAPVTPDANLPEKKVEITGNDQMKFDVTAIEAKPRQKVTVTLKNVGVIPKISMGHNFVLLTPEIDPAKFVEAGIPHMAQDYIAPELGGKVIAHTKLLGPGESDTISFAAPAQQGAYTYICSFPGHFAIGMKGTLSVQ